MLDQAVVPVLSEPAVEVARPALAVRNRPSFHDPLTPGHAAAITHPAFWFLLPRLFDDYWTYIGVGELGIVAVEAGVLAVSREIRS